MRRLSADAYDAFTFGKISEKILFRNIAVPE